jgi:malectin (di-glucose binding ER protein)
MRRRSIPLVLGAALALTTMSFPAHAVNVAHDRVVSADPADWTPWVNNGAVFALVKLGTMMYVGGTFTDVQSPSGSPISRHYLFAFDLTTGAISKQFKPALDGPVNALATDGTSLFVGGAFTTVNTTSRRGLVALDPSGAIVSGFGASITAGTEVDDLVVANGALYVAGEFTQISSAAHSGLAAVSTSTGAVIPGVSVEFTGVHHFGVSGVAKIDVSPDGSTLVAVGNFTTADSEPREQIALLDLTPTAATLSSWSTQRFVMQCAGKFNTYIRDIDIDPTGSYFVVGTTGAYSGGVNDDTLCDTVSRWELGPTGPDQQPTWADYSGGDTIWSVTATGAAVYTGGHFRWFNNPYTSNKAGPGGIKRRAIAALDPINGMPLAWNPGRSPGQGVFIMISTADGLWVGDDTNQIGGETHPRLAFFPLAGGSIVPEETTATLPGELFSLPPDSCPSVDPSVLYRVNAGGPSLPSVDCGPDWQGDTGTTSPYRNSGSNTSTYVPVKRVQAVVPISTPADVFRSERWDPASGSEMTWSFPVPAGRNVRVRLYLSDRCFCTINPGDRVYDVTIDGTNVLNDWDPNVAVGHNTGTMRAFDVTSDGTVDVGFVHQVNNPTIDGIELIDLDATRVTPTPERWFAHRSFDGATAGARTQESSINWERARGMFFANGRVYYGWDDGNMYSRSFDGTTFGSAQLVPDQGLSTPYFAIPAVTGMFLQHGRLYYTLRGDDQLYYRYFTLDTESIGAVTFVADGPGSGFDWGTVRGMTLAGGDLYLARANGTLWSAGWNRGLEHGTPVGGSLTLVSNDAAQQWACHGMFVLDP